MIAMARSSKRAKISICVPCRDSVHSGFAYDLARLMQLSTQLDISAQLHFNCGTIITNLREALLREAVAAGSSHLLWLDSDMMFPPDTLERLLAHQLPVVAANYATRTSPHKTVAYADITDWTSYLIHAADDPALIEVQAVGMGCMLVDLSVVEDLPSPVFELLWQPDSQDHLGEDFVFCAKLRAQGNAIMIDTALSRDLLHLGTKAFGHSVVKPGLL